MNRCFALGFMLLTACGDIAHETPDAQVPPKADAPRVDAPTQLPLGLFSAPIPIAELNTVAMERGPTLTGDMLELYFVSDRPGGLGSTDVWMSTRATVASAWTAPTLVTTVSSVDAEAHPYVTRDGLQLYVTVTRTTTTTGSDIYVAVRANREAAWSTPALATDLNSAADDVAIGMSADGLELVLDSARGGASARDLYLAKRANTASSWGIPEGIAELNNSNNQKTPQLADGGLAIWYGETQTSDEICMATRPSLDAPFGVGVPVAELNTTLTESDPWISDDQRTIVFASTRSGNYDLFIATR
jgi:Tol biopolymer transport system component